MKTGCFLIALALASLLSCSHSGELTLASPSGDAVFISQERETMERLIECALTQECGEISLMALLAQRKVFRVTCGTRVELQDAFTFSSVRRIRVLDGQYAGKNGWVYERMLCADLGSSTSQQRSEGQTIPLAYSSDAGFSSLFPDTHQ